MCKIIIESINKAVNVNTASGGFRNLFCLDQFYSFRDKFILLGFQNFDKNQYTQHKLRTWREFRLPQNILRKYATECRLNKNYQILE